jgi:hypothetical protein
MSDPKQIPEKTFATVSTKEDEMRAVLLWAVGITYSHDHSALPVPRCLTMGTSGVCSDSSAVSDSYARIPVVPTAGSVAASAQLTLRGPHV